MNGTLPPKSVLVDSYSRIVLMVLTSGRTHNDLGNLRDSRALRGPFRGSLGRIAAPPRATPHRTRERRRRSCRCAAAILSSTLREGLNRPPRLPGEELPWPADLVLGVGDHLVQLRDPTDGARKREDGGEQRH